MLAFHRADAVAEVDHLRPRVPRLARSIAPLDRHAAADEAVELPVVLKQRAGEVDARQLLDGLLARRCRQVRVEPLQRRPQVAHQHHIPLGRAPQRALRPERLLVVGVDALPAEHLLQMLGEGLLDQPVFAVDVGDHGCSPDHGRHSCPGGSLPVRTVRRLRICR